MFTHPSRSADKQTRRAPLRALVSGAATAALVGSTLLTSPQALAEDFGTILSVSYTSTGDLTSVKVGDEITVEMGVELVSPLTLSTNYFLWYRCPSAGNPVGPTVQKLAFPCDDTDRLVSTDLVVSGSTVTDSYTVREGDLGHFLVPVAVIDTPGSSQSHFAWPGQIPVQGPSPTPTLSPALANLQVTAGQTATFTTNASAEEIAGLTNAFTYIWESSTDGGDSWDVIPDANGASYTTPVLESDDDGTQFRVTATNTAVATGLNTTAGTPTNTTEYVMLPTSVTSTATVTFAAPTPPSPGGGGGAAAPVAPAVVTPGPSAPASLGERPDPGAARALVGGQDVDVTISPLVSDSSTSAAADRISSLPESLRTIAPQPNGVQVSAGGVGVSVAGPQASWTRSPGLLIVAPDAPLAVKTTGFGAGSPVKVYVQNASGTWVLVDTLTTGPDGTLDAAVTIPTNAPVGPGVLQFEGTNGSGEQVTLSIGAQIAPPVAPVPTADGPLPQVNPGQAVVTDADGSPVEFSVNRVNGTDVEIRVGESLTSIQAVDAEGTQPLAADGAIEIEEEGFVRVGGEGFQPNSMVQVWAFSEATFVGIVLTDENGAYTSLLELPEELELGDHTLQNSGTAFDGQPLAVSAGLRIIAPGSDGTEQPQAVETARANTTVYFGRGSSSLDAADRKKLDRLVRKVGDSPQRVRITGYVQASSTTSNDQSLSRARARSVAAYLRSQGVDAKYTVRGRGVLDAPSDEARSARVTVVYTK